MINIDYMIEYITLAENLNFSKTAEILHVAQPALSRHIAAIEEEMGVKLFSRSTRSVAITPAGKSVYDQFKKIIRIYNQTCEQALMLSDEAFGTLKISSPYYWTADYTEPIVFEFSKLYPQHQIEIISCQPNEGMNQLKRGESDLLLTCDFGFEPDSHIRRFVFATERMGVILLTDNPLAQKTTISIADLKDCVLILLNPEDAYNNILNTEILRLFATYQIEPSKIVYSQQVDTIGMVIQKSLGISIVPYGLRHMDRDYTKMIPLNKAELTMQTSFYYKIGNNNPLIPLFLRVAKDVFANL